jgi:hypothetical protein
MNTEKIIIESDLTEEQRGSLIIWTHDLNRHTIYYPSKIFWRFTRNIPITNEEGIPFIFKTLGEAMTKVQQLKNNKN